MSTTHTFITLEVSSTTYREIHQKLALVGYGHCFVQEEHRVLIDMNGFALRTEHTKIPYIKGSFKHRFAKMKKGDHFIVEDAQQRRNAITTGKRLGHKITSEKTNGNGFRIFLVERNRSSKL